MYTLLKSMNVNFDLIYPLSRFCDINGREQPEVISLDETVMPEPYRHLLVHNGDMTSKLEEFFGETPVLSVISSSNDGMKLCREVILSGAGSRRPFEYGAIEINLQAFEAVARNQVIMGKRPLGEILITHNVYFESRPKDFIKISPDQTMVDAFGISKPTELYGRCNELTGVEGVTIAKIVEILPPIDPDGK